MWRGWPQSRPDGPGQEYGQQAQADEGRLMKNHATICAPNAFSAG